MCMQAWGHGWGVDPQVERQLGICCHGVKPPELPEPSPALQGGGGCDANIAFLHLIITCFEILLGPHARRAESGPDVSCFWMH